MTTDSEPYSKEKLKAVEKTITASVKNILKSKIRLSQSDWGITYVKENNKIFPVGPTWTTINGQCCLTGAVLLTKQPKISVTFDHGVDAVARATTCTVLDVSYRFISGMIQGYDNIGIYPEAEILKFKVDKSVQYIQGFNLGLKLGKKFLTKRDVK